MKSVKTFDVTIKFTKRVIAFNDDYAKGMLRKEFPGCEVVDVKEANIIKKPESKKYIGKIRIGSGSINDQYEFNK